MLSLLPNAAHPLWQRPGTRYGVGCAAYFVDGVWRCLNDSNQLLSPRFASKNLRTISVKRQLIRKMTLHIGKLIRAELDRHPKAHTVTWFAAQLHCDRRNVYDIFTRADIDTHLLKRICAILEHDFFSDISRSLAAPDDAR